MYHVGTKLTWSVPVARRAPRDACAWRVANPAAVKEVKFIPRCQPEGTRARRPRQPD